MCIECNLVVKTFSKVSRVLENCHRNDSAVLRAYVEIPSDSYSSQ